ncbi:MAG: hypothetical protein JWO38_3905 [Gemmataceae bacterium]|nr:hypothetical protein [Gemmataceae bacterium]
MTEEYIDVQARVKTLKAEEEVLNKLLKESGSRDEVLKTREQIRAVRGDIERAQSRLDYLSKLTALSTVTLTLKEIKDYKPPTTPSFGSRVSRTFEESWESLVVFAEGLVLLAIALTPWLPVLIPAGFVGFWVVRKMRRVTNTPDVVKPAQVGRPPRPVPSPPPAGDGTELLLPTDEGPKPG